MNIRPIKTEADYERALAETEQLWGVAVNTPKGDKLDILLTLVEAYEQAHYPIDPPDPVEAIKFRMEQLVRSVSLKPRPHKTMGDRELRSVDL